MSNAMIVNISPNNLQEMVIQNSKHLPVLIHFWSEHNEASQTAKNRLEKLANNMAGKFVLAKINVDQQPEITQKFLNPCPPSYKLIKDADIVSEAEGLYTEAEYRTLLEAHIIDEPSEVLRKQAAQAFSEGHPDTALHHLKAAIKENPNNIKVHLDLVQLYLHTDQIEHAKTLFSQLPEAAQKEPHGRYIHGTLYFTEHLKQAPHITEIQARLKERPNDGEALFYLGVYLILNQQIEPALQTLLQGFSVERSSSSSQPKTALLQAFDMFNASQPELVAKYRRTFQSLLN